MTKKTVRFIRASLTLTLSAAALAAANPALAKSASAAAKPAAQQFDSSRVDPVLYAHQRIGAPYSVAGKTFYPAHNPGFDQSGKVSWYGARFQGKPTANGEVFNKFAMTAAHKTLPLNSLVVVTNPATGKALTVRINDRGPFEGGGIIDLSEAAAAALGYTSAPGIVRVQYAGPAIPAQAPARSLTPTVRLPKAHIAAPQGRISSSNGDQTTVLTIKGPVHLATQKNEDGKPRLIRTAYRVTYFKK